ncbi:hypothetical protein MAR_019700, partial [Mya arenaria]
MDFTENYSCGHADKILTANFYKCYVTLHPVVIYTNSSDQHLSHEYFIYAHNTGIVYAFIKRNTNRLKNEHPGITLVHNITDSPTSQYRNKNTMYLEVNHVQLFGFMADWEADHGKGPCDGVGGSSKRLAVLAVRRQTAVIQQRTNITGFSCVPKEKCVEAYNDLLAVNSKPELFTDGEFKASCDEWIKHTILQQSGKTNATGMRTDIRNEKSFLTRQEKSNQGRHSQKLILLKSFTTIT